MSSFLFMNLRRLNYTKGLFIWLTLNNPSFGLNVYFDKHLIGLIFKYL
jgi:hypothetical protein